MNMILGWTIDQAQIGERLWDSHDSQSFEALVEVTNTEITRKLAESLLTLAGVTFPSNKIVYKVDEGDYMTVGVCLYDDKAYIYTLTY